jgi:hypothetical protein
VNPGHLPVTVCIPAFNAGTTIAETLETLLAQDYALHEIIVSDNHSTDDTTDVVRRYVAHNVRLVENGFVSTAEARRNPGWLNGVRNWNFVLSQSRTDFTALYHADDLYEPTIVGREVATLTAHPESAAVFTTMRTIDAAGRAIRAKGERLPGALRGVETVLFAALLDAILRFGNFLAAPSVMFRLGMVRPVGFFNDDPVERFAACIDLEMWLRLATHHSIALIDQPLMRHRVSATQWSTSENTLRTAPQPHFMTVDRAIKEHGGLAVVSRAAIGAYESQRFVELVTCAVHLHILARPVEAAAELRASWVHLRCRAAVRDPKVFVFAMVGLLLNLSGLLRLSKLVGPVAGALREWIAFRRFRLREGR